MSVMKLQRLVKEAQNVQKWLRVQILLCDCCNAGPRFRFVAWLVLSWEQTLQWKLEALHTFLAKNAENTDKQSSSLFYRLVLSYFSSLSPCNRQLRFQANKYLLHLHTIQVSTTLTSWPDHAMTVCLVCYQHQSLSARPQLAIVW